MASVSTVVAESDTAPVTIAVCVVSLYKGNRSILVDSRRATRFNRTEIPTA